MKEVFQMTFIQLMMYMIHGRQKLLSKTLICLLVRIHGAVAALSQSVPTVIIDYGHEPKAHKLIGF